MLCVLITMYSTDKELKAITQDGCLGLALAQERAVQTFLGPVSDHPARACPQRPGFPHQVETVLPLLLLVLLQAWDVLLGSPFREFFLWELQNLGEPAPADVGGTVQKALGFWTEATHSGARQPCKGARGCLCRSRSLRGR